MTIDTTTDTSLEQTMAKLRDGALLATVGTEAIAWSPSSYAPVLLDPVLTALAPTFDGVSTVREVVEDIAEIFDIEAELAHQHVQRASHTFSARKLLDSDEAEEVEPLDSSHLSPDW